MACVHLTVDPARAAGAHNARSQELQTLVSKLEDERESLSSRDVDRLQAKHLDALTEE